MWLGEKFSKMPPYPSSYPSLFAFLLKRRRIIALRPLVEFVPIGTNKQFWKRFMLTDSFMYLTVSRSFAISLMIRCLFDSTRSWYSVFSITGINIFCPFLKPWYKKPSYRIIIHVSTWQITSIDLQISSLRVFSSTFWEATSSIFCINKSNFYLFSAAFSAYRIALAEMLFPLATLLLEPLFLLLF